MEKYDHKKIETKWQKKWNKEKLYQTSEDKGKPKYYVLDMFPYPSGAGLHVGHPKGYIATDIFARAKMMQGYNVLHPMGWDAFGLPAENYAIQNKVHPKIATERNIETFKNQLEKLGFTYDWDREINTTDPKYYKWTQWAFIKMFERGLAYESNEPVNWCPSCKTVLSNEDLENGKCERCGSEVEQKPMRQWVLKITDYADRLLNDLEKLPDWEESIKEMQRNWIGRSEGAEFELRITNYELRIKVFTTRLDTVFGMTYAVIAPEHKIVNELKPQIKNWLEVEKYFEQAKKKTDLERMETKEKLGVELKGIKAVNPFNGEELPLFVADYVLAHYGTGAIMAVPAHDERDFEFAIKYNLPIKQSIASYHLALENQPDAVRENEKTVERNLVYAIVKHWNEDKYLCLDWKNQKYWTSMVVGGVEKNETLLEAGRREILEETGYKNFKFIKEIELSEIHSYFYAHHKNENRYAKAKGVYVELLNGEKDEIVEAEKNIHSIVWVAKDKVREFLVFSNWKLLWDVFLGKVKATVEDGILVNSGEYSGLKSEEAREKMIEWLEEKKLGKRAVNYKIKDWVFSRQRYWGEPIPIVHCEKCGNVAVPEKELPLKLPEVKNYEPTGTGESPLANIKKWVNTTCPKCGGPAKRETNTMPQWAGSSWYYLRYIDPHNKKALVDKTKEKYWSPVDFYVGGAEHATRHLIYARFWHKFLFDIGVVNYDEPFTRLQHVGLILAEDGRKMSKRWNNVINPDEIVEKYGADAMRVYEMFMGPFSQPCVWSTNGVIGARRFLENVYKLKYKKLYDCKGGDCKIKESGLPRLLHKTIKKVSQDIENFHYNTAIAQMMIFVNFAGKFNEWPRGAFENFLKLLAPFAPHLAEEIWAGLENKQSIFKQNWPKFNPDLIKDEIINLVVQVNGKAREVIKVLADISEEEAKKIALESEKIRKWLGGKEVVKVIFVKGKLVNIVIKF